MRSVSVASLMVLPACAFLLGCETARVVPSAEIVKQEGFIVEGKTRKKEVLDRFGPAQSSFESGALLIYHVQLDEQGHIHLRRDKRFRCDAYVLVFDSHDVLERHSLVKNGCR